MPSRRTSLYDPDGNVVQQSTQTTGTTRPGVVQTHTQSATYNAADWQTSSTDDGLGTSYGYDAAGQERIQTIVDGVTPVTTVLDPQGRATAIGENYGGTGPYTSTFGYNQNDLPVTLTLPTAPSAVQQGAQYDPNSRLTQLSTTGASGLATPLQTMTYGYNAADWTTAATGISGTDTITHDAQGRITAESGQWPHAVANGGSYHCTYDNNAIYQ